MSSALAAGDAVLAASLLAEFETGHAGDATLLSAVGRCKALIERSKWLDNALSAMHVDFEDDHFAAGLGHFREALNLSRGFPVLKGAVDAHVSRQSKQLLPSNWRVAETLLAETAAIQPAFSPDAGLQEAVRKARYDELVTKALYQADRAKFDGKTEQARQALTELLVAYPSEKRLLDRLHALDHPTEIEEAGKPVPVMQPSSAAAGVSATGPKMPAPAAVKLSPFEAWRKKNGIADKAWKDTKDFGTMAATTAMLAAAAFLLWHHFSTASQPSPTVSPNSSSPKSPAPASPTPAAAAIEHKLPVTPAAPPDEQAWKLAETTNTVASFRAFLKAYPDSSHVPRARMKLRALEWAQVDKTDVLALNNWLQLHPNSSYTKEAQRLIREAEANNPPTEDDAVDPGAADEDAIMQAVRAYREAQPGYTAQDAAVTFDPPVIDGAKATLRGRRNDGGDGSAPMVFSLAKTDGVWKVEDVQ